jgi:hypothetical protein
MEKRHILIIEIEATCKKRKSLGFGIPAVVILGPDRSGPANVEFSVKEVKLSP